MFYVLFVFACLRAVTGFSSGGLKFVKDAMVAHRVETENHTFVWNEAPDGIRSCLPALGTEFSDVMGESQTGSFVTSDDCRWFNNLTKAAFNVAGNLSTCVPEGSLHLTYANDYAWEQLVFNLQNVNNISCFMQRLLVVTLDSTTHTNCLNNKQIRHCLAYVREFRPSAFMHNDYNAITWLKSKMALALIHVGITVFIFDADVLWFQVPNITAMLQSNTNADVFYQLDIVNMPALYRAISSMGANRIDEDHYEGIHASGVNTGQVLWTPSTMLMRTIPLAFRSGVDSTKLEQKHLEEAFDSSRTMPLSFMYASACTGRESIAKHSHNWISYHANCIKTKDMKLAAVTEAQRAWSALQAEKGPELFYTIFPYIALCVLCVSIIVMSLSRWMKRNSERYVLFELDKMIDLGTELRTIIE